VRLGRAMLPIGSVGKGKGSSSNAQASSCKRRASWRQRNKREKDVPRHVTAHSGCAHHTRYDNGRVFSADTHLAIDSRFAIRAGG